MTMTPEQIASAWALVNAATKGPWHVAGVRVKLDRQDTHAICKYDEDAKRDVNIANVWYDPKTGLGYADARFIIASRELVPQLLTALEAGVKPGEIERAVWSAMMWAADNNPGFNGVPEYTDMGNSFAEAEARHAAARIRSALTVTPAPDAGKVQALIEALEKINVGEGWAAKIARAALAAMKEG